MRKFTPSVDYLEDRVSLSAISIANDAHLRALRLGSRIVVEPGPTGPPGPAGERGPAGPPGPTANIDALQHQVDSLNAQVSSLQTQNTNLQNQLNGLQQLTNSLKTISHATIQDLVHIGEVYNQAGHFVFYPTPDRSFAAWDSAFSDF